MKWKLSDTANTASDSKQDWDLITDDDSGDWHMLGCVSLTARQGYRAMLFFGGHEITYHLTEEEAKDDLLVQAVKWRMST